MTKEERMKKNRRVLAVLVMLTAIVPLIGSDAIGTSTALPTTITIDFGGLCNQISSSQNNDPNVVVTLPLPATCGTSTDFYTFTDAGALKRVELAKDNSSDTVSLLTVKITRTGNPPDLHMTFLANNLESPPSNSLSNTGYKIEGTGRWNNGVTLAPSSTLIFQGWVDDTPLHGIGYTPPQSVAVPVALDGGKAASFAGKYAASVWSTGTLHTPRTLKGELWVHLAQTAHSLTITSLSVHDYQPFALLCKPKQGQLIECRDQDVSDNN
jgi:hypothetical protein